MPVADDAVIQAHHSTPEARAGFDRALRDIRVGVIQGKYGQTPEEQSTNVLKVLRQAYPDMMPYELGTPQAPSSQAGLPRSQQLPRFDNPAQFLADRGILAREKTFGEEVYPYVQGAIEGGAASYGAYIGSGLGGPVGGMIGSGLGALASRAVDPLTRAVTGTAQQGPGEALRDAGLAVAGNVLLDGIMSPVNSWLGHFNRKHIFYGKDFTGVTPGEAGQLLALEQGSRLAGTYGTRQEALPSPGTFIQGSQGKRNPTFMSWANDVSNVSILGGGVAEKRGVDFQRAKDALATDIYRRLGAEGATRDPALAANIIRDMHTYRFQTSREIRRAVYDSVGQMPGAQNSLDTTPLVTLFENDANRLDYGKVITQADSRFSVVEKDLMEYLRPELQISQATPAGTPVVTLPNQAHWIAQGINPPYSFHYFDPQGNAVLVGQSAAGPMPFHVPAQGITAQSPTPTSNYAKLAELKSTLGYIKRDAQAHAKSAADPGPYLTNARVAGYLEKQVNDFLEHAATSGSIPRATLQGFRYADKLSAEEARTFTNPLVVKIVEGFKDEPETFARELLKPDNADVLVAVHKATSQTPDVIYPHAGTTTAELTTQLQRPSLYRRVTNAQGQTVWDRQIRPMLEKEFLNDALDGQFKNPAERALTQAPGSPITPDDSVRFDSKKLIGNLEALTPNTRVAIFGSEQGYQQMLIVARAMENYQVKQRAGIGSFLVLSKQSGALTNMLAPAGQIGLSALGAGGATALTDNWYAGAIAGGMIFATPYMFAKYVNDPQRFKQVLLAFKQTPKNFAKSRVMLRMMADSIKDALLEAEKAYPVLPGEPPAWQ